MKLKLTPAHELTSSLRAFFQLNKAGSSYLNEKPLRAELYNFEQMERFGKTLATNHKLSTRPAKDHLIKRHADNEDILQEVRKLITESIEKNILLPPGRMVNRQFLPDRRSYPHC